MLIKLALEEFHRECAAANLSENTRQRYRDELGEFARYVEENNAAELGEVTVELLRDYVTYLLNRPSQARGNGVAAKLLSTHTVQGRYRSVHRFFAFCALEGWLAGNPMDRVRQPRATKPLVSRLDDGNVERALRLIDQTKNPQRNLAMILLMVYSGLRRGEVLGLKLSDVNLTEGSVVTLGKGRKMRRVPINTATVHALEEWLAVRPLRGCDRVFVKEDGAPLAKDGIQSLFVRLRKQLGVPRFYPHLLRHTFAAMYLKRVRDFKSLQKILGHARASTTLDIYADFEDFETLKGMHTEAMGDRGIFREK